MNIELTHPAERLTRRAFTVDDIRRMVDAGVLREDERFELVEGDLVMMSAKGYAHELIKSALAIALARSLPDGMTMGVEITLQFDDNTILEPDLAVFKRSKEEARSTHINYGHAPSPSRRCLRWGSSGAGGRLTSLSRLRTGDRGDRRWVVSRVRLAADCFVA